MKPTLSTLLIALTLSAAAVAQQNADEHTNHHASAPAAAPDAVDRAVGEVRKIDKDAARITLKHGEIKSIDMPPMTMVFKVRDKSVLDRIKVGDKVRFGATNEAGQYTVTDIEVVP